MSRLEKKCFIASAGAHSVLMLLLFLWPLLFVSKKAAELALPELTFIPLSATITDGPTQGGGNPNVKTMPAPAARPAPPQLTVAPPPPKPAPAVAREEAEPPPKALKDTESEKSTTKAKPDTSDDSGDIKVGKKKKIEISLTKESGSPSGKSTKSDARSRSDAMADARAARDRYAARVNQIVGAIGQGVSGGTSIDIPGPGGAAFVNYAQFVMAKYKAEWAPPPEFADERFMVKAKVVILRNGSVESFEIVNRSGRPALDESVNRLKHLTFIQPFPEGAQDERRTFYIKFIPKSDE